MTHETLRKLALAALKRTPSWGSPVFGGRCSIVLSEMVSASDSVPDAIGWHLGHSILIECKVSRADFFADGRKHHRLAGTGAGERRFYLCPAGLVTPAEVPESWGLLEQGGRSMLIVKDAPRRTLDSAGHVEEKLMLLSIIRRIRAREFLIISREHADDVLSDGVER